MFLLSSLEGLFTDLSVTFAALRHFLGANLLALNAAVGKHLRGALPAEMPRNRTDWTEDGLFGISYRVLFK